MFYVYLIQSEVDSSFYIGYTSNLELRRKQHNNGETIYSSRKKPWFLVYSEVFENKTLALKRERFLKKQKNRDFYYQLIKSLDR
jgi:putative endonuclease